jgi:hypothetical protein
LAAQRRTVRNQQRKYLAVANLAGRSKEGQEDFRDVIIEGTTSEYEARATKAHLQVWAARLYIV